MVAVAALFDERTILGLNPWVKPSKFLVSVGLFCVVLVGQVLAGRRDGDPQTAN